MPYNFVADSFHTKKLCSRLSSSEVRFTAKAAVTAEALQASIGSKSAISLRWGLVDPKFQVEGVAPTNHSSQKTRLNDVSYDIKIWTDLSFVLSQCMHLTDRQMDGQLSHR